MWPDIYARTPETEFIVDFHREGFKKLLDHWDEIRAEMARQNDGELVTFQSYEMHVYRDCKKGRNGASV